jgi:hypothetical protein
VLTRQRPSTAVLLLVKSLDSALLLEAMRAGVNGSSRSRSITKSSRV